MMRLKQLAAAVALLAAGAVQASTYQGGVTVVDPEFSTFSKGSLAGAFDMYWSFSVSGGPWDLTSSVTSYVNGSKDVDFSRIYLSDGTRTWDYSQTGFDPAEQWSLAPVPLVSGITYEIHTLGSAVGRAGFTGELQLTAAVPEPETYAMFLAGLGLMGAIARRRSRV